jgi:2-methylisocitrate lyase-like PEP mutase family enzyme
VPIGLATDRIREAVAARTNPDTVIVGRTNAIRVEGMDDALRRGEAMKQAGADMLFLWGRKPEEMRFIAERLPAPLMTFAPADGWATFAISKAEMAKMGYRLAASSGTAFAAMVKAVRQSYECLAQDKLDPFLGAGGAEKEMKAAHKVTGLERLLEIERRTMKDA